MKHTKLIALAVATLVTGCMPIAEIVVKSDAFERVSGQSWKFPDVAENNSAQTRALKEKLYVWGENYCAHFKNFDRSSRWPVSTLPVATYEKKWGEKANAKINEWDKDKIMNGWTLAPLEISHPTKLHAGVTCGGRATINSAGSYFVEMMVNSKGEAYFYAPNLYGNSENTVQRSEASKPRLIDFGRWGDDTIENAKANGNSKVGGDSGEF